MYSGIRMKNNSTLFSLMLSLVLSLVIVTSLLTISSSAIAKEDTNTIKLKPGHPQQYSVIKGDTLWDISAIFLDKPWYWPEIWKKNPQIENPDLIYPGDVLQLIYIDGRPYITRDKTGKRTVRLSPQVRVEALNRAIPTIPLDIISPYLTKNRILNSGEYYSSPYIVGINDEHMSAGAGNSIYVMGIDAQATDTYYGIYRRGTAYQSPAQGNEILGYEALYLGEAALEYKGSPATFYVEKSKAEILKGHRLIPINNDKIIEANFLPKLSAVKRPGTIIGVLTNGMQPGVHLVGAKDVVILDIGFEDGAEAGDVFNVYKYGVTVTDPLVANKLIKLPNVRAAKLMIFRTFNRLSYALIMDAHKMLRVGDLVKSPLADD